MTFFFKCLKSPSSAFDITKFVSFSSANFKLYHSKFATNSCRQFYFNCLPRLWNSLPVFSLDLPLSSFKFQLNSRMYYEKKLNHTSMPEIHVLFIICVHVVTAQCLSHLHIILPRLLVSSNKSFRITIPPLSIIISVLFHFMYICHRRRKHGGSGG